MQVFMVLVQGREQLTVRIASFDSSARPLILDKATLNNEVYVFGGYYAKQLGSATDKPNVNQVKFNHVTVQGHTFRAIF